VVVDFACRCNEATQALIFCRETAGVECLDKAVEKFAMLAAGGLKLITPRMKLAEKFKWAATWSDANVKLLGLAEVLGAVGLIVPWLTGMAAVLTPVAAVALTVIMVGAVKTHADRKEPIVPPAVLGALCVFIALGRFGVF